jgi:hypothetical protein
MHGKLMIKQVLGMCRGPGYAVGIEKVRADRVI